MKRVIFLGLISLGLVLSWACNDNNNNPTNPAPSGSSPTATHTPSAPSTPGTPTSTPTLLATPMFLHNYVTSAAPNGLVVIGSVLNVAEGEYRSSGDVTMLECYGIGGGGVLTGCFSGSPVEGNSVITGVPTPAATPPWAGVTVTLLQPQGIVYGPTGLAILDSPSSGSATFYEENSAHPGIFSNYTDSYGGSPFSGPKGIAADSSGNFYVADTANGYVEMFGGPSDSGPPYSPAWLHRWNGSSSSLLFKTPTAIVCDSSNNVWVGDAGYSPSEIEEYSSGGATFVTSFSAVANCVVSGLAVDSGANCNGVSGPCVYVTDTGNNAVEEYTSTGVLVTKWGDPHGPHEFLPFIPGSIALYPTVAPITNIIIGDTNNDLIQVFQ